MLQEKEQLRDMALAREAEERAMREAARRQDEEMERQRMAEKLLEREAQAQNDMRRMDRYGHLQYNDPGQRAPPQHQQLPPQPGHPPPAPPERRSSYDIANQHNLRSGPTGMPPGPYEVPPNAPQTPRSLNNSALRQAETPSSAKKSVSFDSNLATEISDIQPYGSTSTENSLYQQQQQQGQRPQSDQVYVYRGSSSGSSTSDPPPTPFQRPNYGQGTPSHNNEVFDQRTPTNQGPESTLVPGPTPGVVGAQEVYRDPRDRIAAQKANNQGNRNPGPERMSFRDKMSMFAKEAGEQYTPKEKQKTSRAQRVIEVDLNGQSVA